MLPTEQFSGDATPAVPWKPQVWRDGPDSLVKQAQIALFQDRADVEVGILTGTDSAIAGSTAGVQNESDQVIDGTTPGDAPSGSRKAGWNQMLQDLRRTEPLAAWASGQHDGPANPAP